MNTKIGIVDDSELFLSSISLLLETLGDYEVVVKAMNGQDLQHKLKETDQLPDIILVDVNMPVIDGPATVKWLKQEFPGIKLIALSVNASEKAVIEMIKGGCCAYLLKDMKSQELSDALKEVIEKGYYNGDFSNTNFRRLILYEQNQVRLNDRERQFLQLACSDLTYRQIADKMCLSERTIDGYREAIFAKLNVESKVGMVLEAIKRDLIDLNMINLK